MLFFNWVFYLSEETSCVAKDQMAFRQKFDMSWLSKNPFEMPFLCLRFRFVLSWDEIQAPKNRFPGKRAYISNLILLEKPPDTLQEIGLTFKIKEYTFMYSLLEFHLFCSEYIISFPKVIQNIRKNKTKKYFQRWAFTMPDLWNCKQNAYFS